ncbi:MAG: O-antigen ligase family protein [Gammaproteobacteria bacterium]|jgi:O-antigen ligase
MATFFLFWDVSRAVYVLFSLAALGFVIKYRPRMPREHRLYSWPIIAYIAAACLSLIFHGLPDSGINRIGSIYLLLLIAIPLASLFYLSFDPRRNPWIKFVACSVMMGCLALVDILILNRERADAGFNAAGFGFIALVSTSLVIASYHRFRQTRLGMTIFVVAVLMGVCAMTLSGTRTSWIAGIAVFFIAMFYYLDRYSISRRILISLALMASIAVASGTIPIVQQRIDKMIEIVTPYVKGEEQTEYNSLRYRVELWKVGLKMGMDNKIFGYGPGYTKKEIQDYARRYPQFARLATMNHLHNQYIQTFAMTGLIGFVSLMVMAGCHLWLFTKYMRKRYSTEVRSLALGGLLMLVSYLIYSMAAIPFSGKHNLMMYGFASATIWGSLLGALRESGNGATAGSEA